jgi:hypothetical protein
MRRFNLNILMTMGVLRLTFLNIKPQPVFLEGVEEGGFITDYGPKLTIDVVAAKPNMNRAKPLTLMEFDVVKAERFAPIQGKVLQLPPAFARSPNPSVSLESDTVMVSFGP